MKHQSLPALVLPLIFGLALLLCPVAAQAQSFTVSSPTTIFTPQQMGQFGIDFPDGAIGVIRSVSGYTVFGAGGSFGGIGPGGNATGTYKFAGSSLNSLSPAQNSSPQHPIASLQTGRVQPSPDGRDFDRDYAGGGPTYRYTAGGTPELVQIYHGEYHPNYPAGLPFYGGSGMAVSDNEGASFAKIGEIIAPSMTLQEFIASGSNGLPVDGFTIEADASGRPVGAGESADQIYIYDVFSDRNPSDTHSSFAIARIKKADLLEAVALHRAPLFKKYNAASGGFTQPGLGGSFTPIVTQGTDAIAWPQVVYCSFLNKFLLIYQTNQKMIQVRTATDLMHWSDPITLVNNPNPPETFYPAAVGMMHDQFRVDKQFYLFYSRRTTNSNPANPTYYQSVVTINR